MPGIALPHPWPFLVLPDGFQPAPPDRAEILLTAAPDAASQIEAARVFVSGPGARLIIFRLPGRERADWPTTEARAALVAFLRWAALDWAPRGVRTAAISLADCAAPGSPAPNQAPAAPATAADLARVLALLWRVPSLTGQVFRLGPGA